MSNTNILINFMFKRIRIIILIIASLVTFLYCISKLSPYSFYSNLEHYNSLDLIDKVEFSKGADELKKHKVLIVGISRDNRKALKHVIKHIEYTGSQFADYRVVIFENDSTDGTKLTLKLWSLLNNKVTILSENLHSQKRPSIKFLADIRNKYIEYIQNKFEDFDILMVLDMDMHHGWDIRGVYDTFSKIEKWQSVCANGLDPKGNLGDAFAFRNHKFPYNSSSIGYWKIIVPQINETYRLPVDSGFLPVYSCFNAMAFYKRAYIKDCRYDSVNEDCEHVAFHQCIANKNGGKMYMNPAMVIRY